ncbi:MAG: lytic transglycosylase domain-containing protein [Alphaproteobacteria bacterium]
MGSRAGAHETFTGWLEGVRAEAASRGISQATIEAALTDLEPIARVIELDRNQPEFTLSFEEYLELVASASRIETGRLRLAEHRAVLEEVGERFGVEPRLIVALWGVETDFGRQPGTFPVIGALATLAYDGRRGAYFRGELFEALAILEEGHIEPERMIGSWAGAMGQNQFMPSSFRRYAVDYDGDGRRDIWTAPGDIFASAANYLAGSGWRRGRPWGHEVVLPSDFDPALADLELVKRVGEWQALGVRGADGDALAPGDRPASVVLPDGPQGPAYVIYDNYRALMKWNRSIFFATAVGYLADRIGGS